MSRRLAIPVWRDSVSTTCDFARTLLVVEIEGDREVARHSAEVPDEGPDRRAARIRELSVQEVLCGAISRPLAMALADAGIAVFPFVAGSVDEVIGAHLSGRLGDPRFLLPGSLPGARFRWRHGERRCTRERDERR